MIPKSKNKVIISVDSGWTTPEELDERLEREKRERPEEYAAFVDLMQRLSKM
ncbi:hypothetical protein H9M94_03075 [Mycoplasma sp. Pen4]|uniref:hypothetical protein n=1 Tax=Mycoplasma sp. Pen4 TaxID=640330 RepID=UPI001654B546|nr:hypothetical protein [Mycoplasma sp. Pen4]QNM93523.1 hypothetical protein H9M94_02840 [Mycoplasma sp. Pen4]QNM93562.1 hypothetical protein H9M94_03075 [Mycoplasma sp. Pen4]